MAHDRELVHHILAEARSVVLDQITELIEENRATGYGPLYDLVADYPFREGKGLRPAIVLAAARAAGGTTAQARVSAAGLELYHNAFLVHDDVEDESEFRRGAVTMLREHGAAVAINVGDATNVLSMQLLLQNTTTLGVRKALRILREAERMARESVEGQAMELDWIARDEFDLDDRDYVRMAHKKTCWYTVIAPLRIGVLCGHPAGVEVTDEALLALTALGHHAGIAFQVADDLLNLVADETLYGKEIAGDLWEGKRTVMLLHFLRTADATTRRRALGTLRRPRQERDADEIAWMLGAMQAAGSLDHGRAVARRHADRALELDARPMPFFDHDSDDRRFLSEALQYVIERDR